MLILLIDIRCKNESPRDEGISCGPGAARESGQGGGAVCPPLRSFSPAGGDPHRLVSAIPKGLRKCAAIGADRDELEFVGTVNAIFERHGAEDYTRGGEGAGEKVS